MQVLVSIIHILKSEIKATTDGCQIGEQDQYYVEHKQYHRVMSDEVTMCW